MFDVRKCIIIAWDVDLCKIDEGDFFNYSITVLNYFLAPSFIWDVNNSITVLNYYLAPSFIGFRYKHETHSPYAIPVDVDQFLESSYVVRLGAQ